MDEEISYNPNSSKKFRFGKTGGRKGLLLVMGMDTEILTWQYIFRQKVRISDGLWKKNALANFYKFILDQYET